MKALFSFALYCVSLAIAAAQTEVPRLGLIGVLSHDNKFLQAHSNGEIHASNAKRNTEETWILYEIDKANRVYAFQNWDNQRYLSKVNALCVVADRTQIGPWEKFTIISGASYGLPGKVALRAYDGSIVGANGEGHDTKCGGEVSAGPGKGNIDGAGNPSWPGWFRLEVADTPTKGTDILTPIKKLLEKTGPVHWTIPLGELSH